MTPEQIEALARQAAQEALEEEEAEAWDAMAELRLIVSNARFAMLLEAIRETTQEVAA